MSYRSVCRHVGWEGSKVEGQTLQGRESSTFNRALCWSSILGCLYFTWVFKFYVTEDILYFISLHFRGKSLTFYSTFLQTTNLWWDWTWSTRVTRSFNVVPADIYTDNQADPADQDLYIELYNLFEIQLFVPNLQKMSELRDVFPPNLSNCFIK